MYVFLDILVIVGVKQLSPRKTSMVDLLQGYMLTCYIPPGTIIENPHAIVDTEA
jgi:hypothetical protein